LKKIRDNFFSVSEDTIKLCHFGAGKVLSPVEKAFYVANSSVQKILRNLKRHADSLPEFKIFPNELLSSEQILG
jgi:cell shape-determining protein MreC